MSVSVFDKEPEERNDGSMDLFVVFCYYFETFNLNFTCFFNLRLYDSCQSVHLPTHQGSLLIDITSHFENFQPGQMKQPTRWQLVSFSKETNDMTMSLWRWIFVLSVVFSFPYDDYLNLSISGHKKEHFEKTCFKIVISIDLCWLRY